MSEARELIVKKLHPTVLRDSMDKPPTNDYDRRQQPKPVNRHRRLHIAEHTPGKNRTWRTRFRKPLRRVTVGEPRQFEAECSCGHVLVGELGQALSTVQSRFLVEHATHALTTRCRHI